MARRNHNVAAVAQANKTARIVWALLAALLHNSEAVRADFLQAPVSLS